MAGEWIKVENHLHEKVEVAAIAEHTGLEEREQAEADMRRVREYVERNHNNIKGKK